MSCDGQKDCDSMGCGEGGGEGERVIEERELGTGDRHYKIHAEGQGLTLKVVQERQHLVEQVHNVHNSIAAHLHVLAHGSEDSLHSHVFLEDDCILLHHLAVVLCHAMREGHASLALQCLAISVDIHKRLE